MKKIVCLLIMIVLAGTADASSMMNVAKRIVGTFGDDAAKAYGRNATETLAKQLDNLAVTHGDELVLEAVENAGPATIRMIGNVTDEGVDDALRLMSRHGDEAVRVLADPQRLGLMTRYGDEAGDAMLTHPGVADNVIEGLGSAAPKALVAVNAQNARRLGMMNADGWFDDLPEKSRLLDTIAKHGDSAMDFVWKHKKSLLVAGALVAFLNDPEPFIDGTRQLTETIVKEAVAPVATQATESLLRPAIVIPISTMMALMAAWYLWPYRKARRLVKHPQASEKNLEY